MAKYLVINADDFGYAAGVNQGIIAAYEHGIVLSTSLMVDGPRVVEAGVLAKRHPGLGVGLHFTATNAQGPVIDLFDVAAVERELVRQYQRCCDLLGKSPTHLDSHHHIHLRQELQPMFLAWATERRLPLRGSGLVKYDGGFYGHWYDDEWCAHSAPELISVEHLTRILRALPDGVTELACHPGFVSPDLNSSYAAEREIELVTLLDPRVLDLVRDVGITLINFSALPEGIEDRDVIT
jgi:predicted glycoside hydrolase/deacetylase ChbG (UPF0249 family)